MQTLSLSNAGDSPPCTMLIVPRVTCVAMICASAHGRPIAIAPSTRDYKNYAQTAGPESASAVLASIKSGGRYTTRPTYEEIKL